MLPAKKWGLSVLGAFLIVIALILGCEALGWPFLVGPLQRRLSSALDRKVALVGGKIYLLGSVRVDAHRIEVGSPSWGSAPHTFLATGVAVRLRYGDLWSVYRTGALHIDRLTADTFDMQLERLFDGRASWEFKPHQPSAKGSMTDLPTFGQLRVAEGRATLRDAMTPLNLDVRYSLRDGTNVAGPIASTASVSVAASASAGAITPPSIHGLELSGTGRYKNSPLRIEAQTQGVLILEGQGGANRSQPLRLDATVGSAHLVFSGSVQDPLHLTGLRGQFKVVGPSLDAAGAPLGVTLPVTPHFDMEGKLVKEGYVWKVLFDKATIGSSKLTGAFVFDKRGKVALLSGELKGSRLALSDLAPAIGRAEPLVSKKDAAAAPLHLRRVIPDHTFDLPSLRAMNANVLFDVADLDLGTSALESFRPARAHLTLEDGVLSLQDLFARTGSGQLSGAASLDGRNSPAVWTTNLQLRDVELDQWIHQKRGQGGPPYIAGKLQGQLKERGTGRSVAEILGNMNGSARFHMSHGSISHLALKAAGLDVAGGLKVLLEGDKPLPILCNIADLSVTKGVIRPKVFVVSLGNATVWATGQVSLKDETLDVQTVSSPKDFSPMTLRTPIDIKGTLEKPSISVQASGLVSRAGAAVLLGLLNPLAALIPFLDPGARKVAHKEDLDCATLVQKMGMRR